MLYNNGFRSESEEVVIKKKLKNLIVSNMKLFKEGNLGVILENRKDLFGPEYLKQLRRLPMLSNANDFVHGSVPFRIKTRQTMTLIPNTLSSIVSQAIKSRKKPILRRKNARLKTFSESVNLKTEIEKSSKLKSKIIQAQNRRKRRGSRVIKRLGKKFIYKESF